MKFFASLKSAFLAKFFLTLLCGIVYPFFMWCVGQLFFHREAEGSLYTYKTGEILGSVLIAQNFTSSRYFHSRPSDAGNGYDASSSSASNLGPTSQKLIDHLKQRAADYRAENNLSSNAPIPADAITSSGSGLDPHISLENAKLQASRVASARNLSQKAVLQLIDEWTEGGFPEIFGTKRVNVLELNLALDKQQS